MSNPVQSFEGCDPPNHKQEGSGHIFEHVHDLIEALSCHVGHVGKVGIAHTTRQVDGLPRDRTLDQDFTEHQVI